MSDDKTTNAPPFDPPNRDRSLLALRLEIEALQHENARLRSALRKIAVFPNSGLAFAQQVLEAKNG